MKKRVRETHTHTHTQTQRDTERQTETDRDTQRETETPAHTPHPYPHPHPGCANLTPAVAVVHCRGTSFQLTGDPLHCACRGVETRSGLPEDTIITKHALRYTRGANSGGVSNILG